MTHDNDRYDKPRGCPECGNPFVGDVWGTDYDGPTCSPLRCPAWKVVGKWTKPVGVNGHRTLLQVVDDDAR